MEHLKQIRTGKFKEQEKLEILAKNLAIRLNKTIFVRVAVYYEPDRKVTTTKFSFSIIPGITLEDQDCTIIEENSWEDLIERYKILTGLYRTKKENK